MAIVQDLGAGGAVDKPYGSPNRVVATAAAVAATVPQYPGEIVLAADTGARYRALGPAAANGWGHVTDRMN
jgi:hypothetical protein